MKTKSLFLVLAVLFMVAGCRSTKQVNKTDITASTAANIKTQTSDQIKLAINKKTDNKQAIDSSKTIVDKSSIVEDWTEETEHIKMSVPDQNGKQYITDKIKTKKTTTKGENRNLKVDQETSSKSDHETELRDRSEYTSDSTAVDKTKHVETMHASSLQETKTPEWLSISVIILSVGLIALIYWVLKRYKVIK